MVQHDGGLGGEDGMVLQQGRPQGAQQGPVRESVGCHMCSRVCVCVCVCVCAAGTCA